ncbi:MAG: phenylalanine--tRNA ligase subunit beta [Acidimicrobiales bacterium]
MKVLLSWLREFAPLDDDPAALAETLSNLGMAVESMELLGAGFEGIVVARVLDLRPIPGADSIQLVEVDAGRGDPVEVVCGAFNMAVGNLVPLATVGTVMLSGFEIGRRRMKGQWSNGMLCSPPELGLPGDASGILILPAGLTPGQALSEALGVENDVLYDLEVNPNRPDAMGVAGVARDLAAWYKVPFSLPEPHVEEDRTVATAGLAAVEILDPDLCGRFVARVLLGVTVGDSPASLANRLTLLGMRPINSLVDVSNYVMLELGRPNHPYDLATLPGGAIRVRRATAGETMVTLDEVERQFSPDDLLICDGTDRAIGIAGIMGGADTEISPSTKDVLLEMAWFQPMAIAKTSRRLGLRSEASARFEKGCDPFDIEIAALRFVELLGAGAGRLAAGLVDARGDLPVQEPVRVRTARVNDILGTALTPVQIAGYLTPIGFDCVTENGDLDVTIPSFRLDSSVEIDVIEEIARHHGYERIGKVVPPSVHIGALTDRQQDRRAARRVLTGLGLAEAMPVPFLAPGDLSRAGLTDDGITITNPLVAEESVLRTSLLPGLLKALAYNARHRNTGVRLFEIGHVFLRPMVSAPLPDEQEHLAAALGGMEAPEAVKVVDALVDALGFDGFDLVAAELAGLHPTRSARVVVRGNDVGVVGEVDPGTVETYGVGERVAWCELDFGRLLDLPHGERTYRVVSKYPSSDIDLAFEVDESVPAAAVERAIGAAGDGLLVRLELFDVYRGPAVDEGWRSLAYRLRLQAPDRTLTDEDIATVRQRCIDAVESSLPAHLRT